MNNENKFKLVRYYTRTFLQERLGTQYSLVLSYHDNKEAAAYALIEETNKRKETNQYWSLSILEPVYNEPYS